jgi:hypothetical protein
MTQLLRSLIREALLLEEIYGAQATVYHGTEANPQVLIQAFLDDTFNPGEGSGYMYGKGLYAVHKLEGTQTQSGGYGPHILKLKVKLDDYIIFDRDVATRVYGKPLLPQEQALRAGLDDTVVERLGEARFNRLFDPKDFSSGTAEKASSFLAGKCKGIVYTGKRDGRCVLVYDPTTVVPMAWKPIRAKTWNPVEKSSLKGALRRSASGEWEEEKYTSLKTLRRLEKLPPNQRVVNGNLDLRDTSITSLPQGLKVGRDLKLENTPITSLPQGLKVGGSLWLTGTSITSLPQDLVVGDSLLLSDTPITSLPQGLKVSGDLSLRGTPITSLPQGLEVGDWLDLTGTPITSLPQGLKVGGSLWLKNTPITSLPQDLQVGGNIRGFKGDLSNVPPHLQAKIQ